MKDRTSIPRAFLIVYSLLLAAACTLFPAWAEASSTTDRLGIVDRAIEYHGGELYRSTETRLVIRSRSGAFELVSRMDGERFDHTVVGKTSDGKERRVRSTNEAVEETRGGEAVALDAEAASRARDFVNARVYFPFLPFRLNDPGVHKQDLGLERWGERDLHKVKITFEEGSSTDANDEYLYWFDPETGRLEQFAYSFGTGTERGGLRLRKAFNHRRVGGILFFDSENWGLDGGGDLRVEEVTPEHSAEAFEKISTVVLEDIEVRPLAAQAEAAQASTEPAMALTVDDLGWIAGQWVGEREGELIEEIWTAPAHGGMMGMFRWVVPDGTVRVYELLALEPGPEGPMLWLRHFNTGLVAWEDKGAALGFALVPDSKPENAVFVFRKEGETLRLTYRKTPGEALTVTLEIIEDEKVQVLDFVYQRAR